MNDINGLNPLAAPHPHRTRAIIALMIVNAMWGASFPVMKLLNLQVDQHFGVTDLTASGMLRASSAAWMIAIRFALALVLFAIFFRKSLLSVGRPQVIGGVVMGTCFFVGLVLQVVGLGTIPASRSGFLTSLAVVFTPVMSTIYWRRLPRVTVLTAAVLSLAGVAFLTGLVEIGGGSLRIASDSLARWTWGDTLTVVGAIFFSLQILALDWFGKQYESLAITPVMFATVVVLGGVTFGVLKQWVPEVPSDGGWMVLAWQPRFVALMLGLAIFPSLIAFAVMNKFQPILSAVQAAVIYTLEPLMASLWAMFLPGLVATAMAVQYANESFTMPLVIGGAMLAAANILALWPTPTKTNTAKPIPVRREPDLPS